MPTEIDQHWCGIGRLWLEVVQAAQIRPHSGELANLAADFREGRSASLDFARAPFGTVPDQRRMFAASKVRAYGPAPIDRPTSKIPWKAPFKDRSGVHPGLWLGGGSWSRAGGGSSHNAGGLIKQHDAR